jgi:putative tricarboxylic transport membrane protein
MQARLRRAATYGAILLGAAYLYFLASNLDFEHVAGRVGPDAWPKIVLGLLIATCVWQLVRVLALGAVPATEKPTEEELVLSAGSGNYIGLAILAIAATAVYAILLPTFGFFITTVLFIAGIALIGRYRNVVPLIATSIIAPLVLMFIFMRIVYIALPLGRGTFKEVSLFLLHVLGVH